MIVNNTQKKNIGPLDWQEMETRLPIYFREKKKKT